ncbi:hypothetical protein PMAYCL1PPCAC_01123, partial [Pristionchus mayeri]
ASLFNISVTHQLQNMVRVLLFAAIIGYTWAAVMQYPLKVGDKLELDLGRKGIKVWQRTTKDGKQETTRFCGPAERNIACGSWVDENFETSSAARVTSGGKLIIEKVTVADSGSYSTPDDKPRFTKHADGSVSAVAGTMIHVSVFK